MSKHSKIELEEFPKSSVVNSQAYAQNDNDSLINDAVREHVGKIVSKDNPGKKKKIAESSKSYTIYPDLITEELDTQKNDEHIEVKKRDKSAKDTKAELDSDQDCDQIEPKEDEPLPSKSKADNILDKDSDEALQEQKIENKPLQNKEDGDDVIIQGPKVAHAKNNEDSKVDNEDDAQMDAGQDTLDTNDSTNSNEGTLDTKSESEKDDNKVGENAESVQPGDIDHNIDDNGSNDLVQLLHKKLSEINPKDALEEQVSKISIDAIDAIAKKLYLILPTNFEEILTKGLIEKLKDLYKEGVIKLTVHPDQYEFCTKILESDKLPSHLKGNFEIIKDDTANKADCILEWSNTKFEYNQDQLHKEIDAVIEQLKGAIVM